MHGACADYTLTTGQPYRVLLSSDYLLTDLRNPGCLACCGDQVLKWTKEISAKSHEVDMLMIPNYQVGAPPITYFTRPPPTAIRNITFWAAVLISCWYSKSLRRRCTCQHFNGISSRTKPLSLHAALLELQEQEWGLHLRRVLEQQLRLCRRQWD